MHRVITRLVLALLLVGLASAAFFYGQTVRAEAAVRAVIRQYIEGAARLDWDRVQTLLAGGASRELMAKRDAGGWPLSAVERVEIRVIGRSDRAAWADARVVTRATSGEKHIGAFRFYLVRSNDWRIYAVEEIDPLPAGRGASSAPAPQADRLRRAIGEFLRRTQAGDLQAASQILEGPARDRAQQVLAVLPGAQAGWIGQLSDLDTEVIYYRHAGALVRARYRLGDRDLASLFWLVATGEDDWRIVRVDSE